MRNTSLLAAGLTLAACLTGLGPAPVVLTANEHGPLTVENNVELRPCVELTNPHCTPVGTTGTSGIKKMRCWRDQSWHQGRYSSDRWFIIELNNGQEGWVHSSYVEHQTKDTPNCDKLPYVRAADWAITHIGEVAQPNGTDWSGWCATFVYRAFREGAGIDYRAGDALVQFRHFRDAGKIDTGMPRFGEPVFYDIVQPYGHVAIYIGGNSVVTTQGLDGDHKPVARRDLHSFANYLGWAVIE
jgi:hypothetical protein